jgi:hypothetical protein
MRTLVSLPSEPSWMKEHMLELRRRHLGPATPASASSMAGTRGGLEEAL